MSLPEVICNVPIYGKEGRSFVRREVEVLTVHFATGKMRVRWVEDGTKHVYDILNDEFLEKYCKELRKRLTLTSQ